MVRGTTAGRSAVSNITIHRGQVLAVPAVRLLEPFHKQFISSLTDKLNNFISIELDIGTTHKQLSSPPHSHHEALVPYPHPNAKADLSLGGNQQERPSRP